MDQEKRTERIAYLKKCLDKYVDHMNSTPDMAPFYIGKAAMILEDLIDETKIRQLPGITGVLQYIEDHPQLQTKIVNDISHFYRPAVFSRIEQVYTTNRGVVLDTQLAITELRNLKINYIIQTCNGAIAKCYEYGTEALQGTGSQPANH